MLNFVFALLILVLTIAASFSLCWPLSRLAKRDDLDPPPDDDDLENFF